MWNNIGRAMFPAMMWALIGCVLTGIDQQSEL
jgi:hypothetical protein